MIPQCEPTFDHKEAAAVAEYMCSGGWITEHTKTAEFERAIAEYTGAKHAIVVTSGTAALTLAAMAVLGPGLTEECEIIVPNYTMIATANAFRMLGCEPVFVDVEPETLCLDAALVAKAVTSRTRAIVLVTANGREPRLWPYVDGLDVPVIEDAAQSLGSRSVANRHCGRLGEVGIFSFSSPKIVSTGQGGALITDDDDLASRIRGLKDFGRAKGGTDVHDTIGLNFKTTDLQSVVGLEQMKKLPAAVERKKAIRARYEANLADVPEVRFFRQAAYSTPWFVDGLFEQRDRLQGYLRDVGIGSRVMYPPINAQKCYQVPGSFPVSERVGREGLWLPSAAKLTDEQIDRVCSEIRYFYRRNSA